MGIVSTFLREPRLKECDVEGTEIILRHRAILRKKPMIYGVMREIYSLCRSLDERYFMGIGQRIELGGGSSLMKELYPDVIVTDIKHADILDGYMDAQNMDLAAESVRAFYGVNCFHHFPDPQLFFKELNRTLQPGGGCILVEPYFGIISRILYPYLFTSEGFDLRQREWIGSDMQGAMTGANQALSYIVFKRDRHIFEQRNPGLELVYDQVLNNYIRYLMSGGLNFRQLAPSFLISFFKAVEWLIKPMGRITALHHVIVIRKKTHLKGQF